MPDQLGRGRSDSPSKTSGLFPPTGISAELTLPFAGRLGHTGDRPQRLVRRRLRYRSWLCVRSGAGAGSPARGRRPSRLAGRPSSWSFLFPGIQLGLGLRAYGGQRVVAINRRTNFEALEPGVLDGRATSLLAPATAGSNPSAALSAMVEIFPEARGRFVIGPLLQISWADGDHADDQSDFDLPSPPTLAVLGRLAIAIPDPAAPLALIGVTFVAPRPMIPMVRVTGSLVGSSWFPAAAGGRVRPRPGEAQLESDRLRGRISPGLPAPG